MTDDRPIWASRDDAPEGAAGGVSLQNPPSSIADDDLDAQLSAPPPSARSLLATKVLGVGLAVVLGFTAGAFLEQRTSNATSASRGFAMPEGVGASGMPEGFPGAVGGSGSADSAAAGATGASGASSSGATTVTGTVTVVDDAKVYLTTSSGSVVTVTRDADTVVASTSGPRTVTVGSSVIVTGTTGSGGAVAADTIIVTKGS